MDSWGNVTSLSDEMVSKEMKVCRNDERGMCRMKRGKKGMVRVKKEGVR